MKPISCKHCGVTGVALFRQNPKGKVGVFFCRMCNEQIIDLEVEFLVKTIEEGNEK